MRIAHIINPVVMPETSDLFVAQPVTFEAMRTARAFARDRVDVALFTAQYPEDRELVPEDFTPTPDLERSVLDFGAFPDAKRLPLIGDILGRLVEVCDAEVLIYSNVDIAPLPGFYTAVARYIEMGYDALVINRRTISAAYRDVRDLPLMYAQAGEPHPGHDCFVFRREAYPAFILGTACVGANWVGRLLLCNLACHARRFAELTDVHLTFHIGDDRVWRQGAYSPYNDHNEREVLRCLDEIEARYGPLAQDTPAYQYMERFRRFVDREQGQGPAEREAEQHDGIARRIRGRLRLRTRIMRFLDTGYGQ